MDNLEFEKKYKKSGFASQRRYPNEALVRFLGRYYFTELRRRRKNMRFLEVGCGSGANLWVIAKEGFDTYGVDNAPSSLPLCRKMLESYGVKAKLSIGTVRKLNYKSNFFDVIADILTVEHTDIRGHHEAFAEIFRVLKPGGRFFSWHLGSKSANFTHGGGNKLDRYTVDNTPNTDVPYSNNGITCFLTVPLARRLLTSAGFVDINIERVTRSYKKLKQEVEYFAISARKP